jgi:hypothetical protein
MSFEIWWKAHWQDDAWWEMTSGDHTSVAKAAWQASSEFERTKWADWIGNVLTLKHPEHKALLWGIAEAIERNNYGVVAKTQREE